MPILVMLLLLLPLLLCAGCRPDLEPLRPPLLGQEGYVGSRSCRKCHPSQHSSWSQTFHSTMTQHATKAAVAASFDGQTLIFAGHTVRPFQQGDRFFFEMPAETAGNEKAVRFAASRPHQAEVAMTVGSRRYQQYFEWQERPGGAVLVRIPWLWNLEEQRWMHLNTVFLHPDSTDFWRHRSVWNLNCIFCHNTGPRPGFLNMAEAPSKQHWSFDSSVADLGIGCESCHGPGAEHAAAYQNPLRRYQGHLEAGHGDWIVHPDDLQPEQELAMCGSCHGQRLPHPAERIGTWLTAGPTFRPGEALDAHALAIQADTAPPSSDRPDLFRQRFWGDGTPRLTAYEFQGTWASPCRERGELRCGSCHTMHSGDPKGMLRPEILGNAACTQCHGEILNDLEAHTKHPAESAGSQCLDCHMPRIVYGILNVHRSHRIENPDPARDVESGRPHACTLCHWDKSPGWATTALQDLWGLESVEPKERHDRAPLELADGVATLHAGDAVQRSVLVAALGRGLGRLLPAEAHLRAQHLALTCGDAYPNIRWLARRSLLQLDQQAHLGLTSVLESWDAGSPDGRREVVAELLERLREQAPMDRGQLQDWEQDGSILLGSDGFVDVERVKALLDLQTDRVISIGE